MTFFNVCYASSWCKTTAESQTFSNHPKVTASPKITGAVILGILRSLVKGKTTLCKFHEVFEGAEVDGI